MKKKLHFHYQLYDCYISFGLWIQLIWQSVLLVIRRILRFFKRIMMYLKTYIPILICIVLFEFAIIPIGINLKKYGSWMDGFWDLRLFMLTSILISTVVGIFSGETKRHKELIEQYSTYESFKFASEKFIFSLGCIADFMIEIDLFLSEEKFDDFYTQLKEKMKESLPQIKNKVVKDKHLLYSTEKIPRIMAIKIYFEQYYRALNNTNNSLLTHKYIGDIKHALNQIDCIFNELKAEYLFIEEQKEGYTDIQLLKFIDSLSRAIYPAIADIRKPWRWDIRINKRIYTIICKSQEN